MSARVKACRCCRKRFDPIYEDEFCAECWNDPTKLTAQQRQQESSTYYYCENKGSSKSDY